MSKRKNGTLRVAKQLGINPYGWGNGKGRKRKTPAAATARESK